MKENNQYLNKELGEDKIGEAVNEEGCEMEDVRAFSLINNLQDIAEEVSHIPEDLFGDESSIETIQKNGFFTL